MEPSTERDRGRRSKNRKHSRTVTPNVNTEPATSPSTHHRKRKASFSQSQLAKRAKASIDLPSEKNGVALSQSHSTVDVSSQSRYHDPNRNTDTGPCGNITRELMTGEIAATSPTDSGFGLQYVPPVKGENDWNQPDVIRIIIVHPGAPDDELECSIKISLLPIRDAAGIHKNTSVNEMREGGELPMHEFVALSYTWEDQSPTEPIYIRHPKGRLTLRVTSKAFELMRKLRVWQNFEKFVEMDTHCKDWNAFIKLMQTS